MALSALDDKALNPTPADLTRVLGPSEEAWHHLVSRIEATYGPLSAEWSFSGAKYGWSFRLRRKKRTILYMIPQERSFLVGLVLGDRALALLRRDDLDGDVLALIDEAPRYGEGTGFRIPVTSISDCSDIETIVEAKMS
jgi:hypothetical protein